MELHMYMYHDNATKYHDRYDYNNITTYIATWIN